MNPIVDVWVVTNISTEVLRAWQHQCSQFGVCTICGERKILACYRELQRVKSSRNVAVDINTKPATHAPTFFVVIADACVAGFTVIAVGHWTCDLQVAGSIPVWWLSRNIGQLSLASLRGR